MKHHSGPKMPKSKATRPRNSAERATNPTRREFLRTAAGAGLALATGLILEKRLALGTVVVSELPQKEGSVIEGSEPGWYALVDNPALSGKEITNPEEKSGENGEPIAAPAE